MVGLKTFAPESNGFWRSCTDKPHHEVINIRSLTDIAGAPLAADLEEAVEIPRSLIGNTDYLVCRLTMQFEVDFSFRLTIVPRFE